MKGVNEMKTPVGTEALAVEPVVMEFFPLAMAAPEEVLAGAQWAAAALERVVAGKSRKVVLNGEQYLEFEDWQTVGRFYGVTAEVVWARFVQCGSAQGFEARAVVHALTSGEVLSAAEAVCLSDEPMWSPRPLYQLKSMAQTRACAKALRNVLAWVVVLAGYRPTPAEEMSDGAQLAAPQPAAAAAKAKAISPLPTARPVSTTTPALREAFNLALCRGLYQRDSMGQPLFDLQGNLRLDPQRMGEILKAAGLPGTLREMSEEQLAIARLALQEGSW
ncbi:MAG: hypothetical protein WCP58_09740 [bacterium]